ncbi:MAG: hypothetical protein ACRDTG_02950 [Pseudonocardiaceae bacterium]
MLVRTHFETVPYTRYPATDDLDARVEWVGSDDRGIELEVIIPTDVAAWPEANSFTPQ